MRGALFAVSSKPASRRLHPSQRKNRRASPYVKREVIAPTSIVFVNEVVFTKEVVKISTSGHAIRNRRERKTPLIHFIGSFIFVWYASPHVQVPRQDWRFWRP
jgi:hypothetical protein